MSAPASLAFEGRFMDQEVYRQQALRVRDLADRGPIRSLASFFWLSPTSRPSRPAERPIPLPGPDRPGTGRQRMKKAGRGRGPLRPAQRHRIPDAAPAGTSAAPYPAGTMLEMQRQGARVKANDWLATPPF
jgi:hypothetical protein